jgi:hypothetical protein
MFQITTVFPLLFCSIHEEFPLLSNGWGELGWKNKRMTNDQASARPLVVVGAHIPSDKQNVNLLTR